MFFPTVRSSGITGQKLRFAKVLSDPRSQSQVVANLADLRLSSYHMILLRVCHHKGRSLKSITDYDSRALQKWKATGPTTKQRDTAKTGNYENE